MAPQDVKDVDFGDHVDQATFDQILEMDEEGDETREFSSSIVFDFLNQARTTFEEMDRLIKDENLPELSSQGHFLKGSSATLGFVHIRDACEKIQHYGHLKNEDGTEDLDKATALKLIRAHVTSAKDAYHAIQIMMEKFFGTSAEKE